MYYSVRSFGFFFDFYLLLSIFFFLVRSLGLQSIILVFLSILYIYTYIHTYMYFLTMQKLNIGAVLRRRMNYHGWKWNCRFPKLCVFFLLFLFAIPLALYENQSLRPRCVYVARTSLHGPWKHKMLMAFMFCVCFSLFVTRTTRYTFFFSTRSLPLSANRIELHRRKHTQLKLTLFTFHTYHTRSITENSGRKTRPRWD